MKPYLARTIPAKMKEKSKDFRKKILTRQKQSDCQAINLPSLIESPHWYLRVICVSAILSLNQITEMDVETV